VARAPARSTAGMTWSARSWEISRACMCFLGTPRTCGRAPRSPTNHSRTSYNASPSTAHEIVHAFLEGTTSQDLVHELERSPPVDSNELFNIATSFASGEEAVGPSSTARRANTWTMRPRRVASPRSSNRNTSEARKARSPTATRA
jgi:hypothetical protein